MTLVEITNTLNSPLHILVFSAARRPSKSTLLTYTDFKFSQTPTLALTLFRAGSERFDSGRGGGAIRRPVRSQKPSIGATIGKRCWIGLSKIYNFCEKHFRVRSILRSPEVIKYKMSKKNVCNCSLHNFWTKRDSDMGLAPLCFSRRDDSKNLHDDLHRSI